TGAVIAVSEQVRDDLVRLGVGPPERFAVIPYGFDFSDGDRARGRELVGAADEFVVGWVGRLTAIKQPLDAVRAARGLVLCMVGDGELRGETEALARELGVDARLVGFQKGL